MKAEKYYALKQRETDGWLTIGFREAKIVKSPVIVKRIKTAKYHRLLALKHNPSLFPIDIHEIEVRTEAKDKIAENEIVQQRLVKFLSVLKDKGRYLSPDSVDLFVSMLESSSKNRDMRYIAIIFDSNKKHDINKDIINYSRKGSVYLLKSETDLTLIRLYEDFRPVFIYDFDENIVVVPSE